MEQDEQAHHKSTGSEELPNQVEELAQWYLNKSFLNFKNTHKNNESVLRMPHDQRDTFIQKKFDELFNMSIKDINHTRIEGKQLILAQGDFTTALENYLLRAYISLERVDIKQQQVTKAKFSEHMVKILKLMYICISLRPDYIVDQQNQNDSDRSSKRVRLEYKSLLKDIAKDIYMEELFNRGLDSKNRELKPSFEELQGSLDMLVTCNRYDNQRAKNGKRHEEQPSPEEQKAYLEPKLEDMQYDFMPKQKNQVYHVVSAEWFKAWKSYVGIDQETPQPEDGPEQNSLQQNFKNLSKNQKKKAKKKEQQEFVVKGSINPGQINGSEYLVKLCIENDSSYSKFLPFNDDQFGNMNLLPATQIQEEVDYILLDETCFKYLYSIYGGTDIRRTSIELQQDLDEPQDISMNTDGQDPQVQSPSKEHIVEIHLRKLVVQIIPQMSYYPTCKSNPFIVFISRNATVGELHVKIAQSLHGKSPKHNQHSIHHLVQMSRLWKLETGENISEIQNQIYATNGDPKLLPIEINGKILDRNATIDSINVADDETLMYEVRISQDPKATIPFAFVNSGASSLKKKQTNNDKFQQMARNQSELEEEERKRMNMKLLDVMRQNSQGGLTGLQNLGNTCFMNSVLQCLANTEPLTKYFLFEVYQFHLNPKNVYGTRGKLAIAFAGLVQELFLGNQRYIAPWDVKQVVARKAIQFAGFAQHDSQEMLSVLLETMHEDVNEISKKPYVEYKDSNNRSDEEISKEFWEGFQKREKSIFVDLFYGQLKSRVQCTQCDHVSLTFDPFNVLSLPVPNQKNMNFSVKYIPCEITETPQEFQISVGEYVTVNEIRQKVEDYLISQKYKDGKPDDDWICPFLAQVTDKNAIELITEEKFVRTQGLEKLGQEIIAYEREPLSRFDYKAGDDVSDFHICELRMVQSRRSFMLFSQLQQIGYSRMQVFKKAWTVKQIRLRIYELLRPMILKIPEFRGRKYSYKEQLDKEYDHFFVQPNGEYNIDNSLYDIEIHNNLPPDTNLIFSRQTVCDFCDQNHKDNCQFAFADDVTLENVLSLMKYERELELTINWKSSAKVNFKVLESPHFKKVNLNSPNQRIETMSNSSNISIYDCLSTFGQEETLAGNDKWYCSKCKDHVPALKKMEIYKTPEYLIVHFKRFSHQRNSMFGSRKLNMQIDFPVQELDMTSYLVENIQPNAEFEMPNNETPQSTSSSQQRRFIYDLYAVSNHYGSLNGGHYTAFCKNPIAQKWYEFDDSQVSKVGNTLTEVEESVVTKAAYVLFYKLRN